MKQIVDKLNKIAKAIDSNVRMPKRKLIIDSLDAITRALKGKIIDSHLIVDKLQRIALACEDWDGGGGSDECCFDYREVSVIIDDRVSADDTEGQKAFFIDFTAMGCVVPENGRHINASPTINYEWTGEEILDNENPVLRCVNYKDFSPLQDPFYTFVIFKLDYFGCDVTITGQNCDVNENPDGLGWIVTIPERNESNISITIRLEEGTPL